MILNKKNVSSAAAVGVDVLLQILRGGCCDTESKDPFVFYTLEPTLASFAPQIVVEKECKKSGCTKFTCAA